MLFKLYNVLIIFQSFINKILNFYLNNFYIVYKNNILIYIIIKKKYKNYIKKIFAKLYKANLYLNLNKYIIFIK